MIANCILLGAVFGCGYLFGKGKFKLAVANGGDFRPPAKPSVKPSAQS